MKTSKNFPQQALLLSASRRRHRRRLRLVAISAGWVDAQSTGTTTIAAAPLAAPAVDTHSTGNGNTVHQIYQRDGQGVAFIQAQQPVRRPLPFDPFGESQVAVSPPGRAS